MPYPTESSLLMSEEMRRDSSHQPLRLLYFRCHEKRSVVVSELIDFDFVFLGACRRAEKIVASHRHCSRILAKLMYCTCCTVLPSNTVDVSA